jgi:hypothetical protein
MPKAKPSGGSMSEPRIRACTDVDRVTRTRHAPNAPLFKSGKRKLCAFGQKGTTMFRWRLARTVLVYLVVKYLR